MKLKKLSPRLRPSLPQRLTPGRWRSLLKQRRDSLAKRLTPGRRSAGLFGVAGIAVGFFAFGIDSDWLQEQIVSRVEESLEAEIHLDNLEVNVFTGSATLVGVDFLREGDNSVFELLADRIDLNLELTAALGGELHFQELHIDSPSIDYRTWPPTEPPEEEERPPMEFEEFTIEGGDVAIRIEGSADDAFVITANDIEYRNTGIDLAGVGKPVEMFYGADVKTTLDINGPVPLEKSFTPEQTVIALLDVDAAYFDRHFGRGKGFQVESGTFAIEGRLVEERVVQEMVLSDLELDRTPQGAWGRAEVSNDPDVLSPKFDTSVPPELQENVDALLDYVERQGGEIRFEISETDKSLIPEDNLHAFMRWWWLQVWNHLAAEAAEQRTAAVPSGSDHRQPVYPRSDD